MINIVNRFFVKKIHLDHLILFKFCQCVVKIVSKELHVAFWTSSNGNMKGLERKNPCKKIDVQIGYFFLPLQMLASKVWNPTSVYATS